MQPEKRVRSTLDGTTSGIGRQQCLEETGPAAPLCFKLQSPCPQAGSETPGTVCLSFSALPIYLNPCAQGL